MAKEVCAFCGEKIGLFGGENVLCAGVYQPCCKTCAGEVAALSQEDRCRRALQSGCAVHPDTLRDYLAIVETAEEQRPASLCCGEKVTFRKALSLYNLSPGYFEGGDTLAAACQVQPAACARCGRLEFFDLEVVLKNKALSYLVKKDTGEIK